MEKFFWTVLVTATTLLLAGRAWAEEASPPCATVTECTQRGEEAYSANRYAEAERFLRERLSLEPNNIYFQLALAQTLEGLGDCASLQGAQELYSQITGEGAVPANARAGLSRIAADLAACEEEEAETSPEPPTEEPPAVQPTPPEPPTTPAPHGRGGGIAAWSTFGVGVTTLATGIVLWIPAYLAADERDSFCSEGGCLDIGEQRQWGAADEDFRRFALAGDILVGLGAAIAMGGLIWALVARHRGETPTAAVSFWPSRGGGGGLVFTLCR